MPVKNKISIIGAGNVAWHLAQALEQIPDFTVLEVYSRSLAHAEKLSRKLLCTQATDDLNFSKSKADIFLVAVSDDALAEVLSQLKVSPEAVIAHTSGSQPLAILGNLPNPKGVFYPLQTLHQQTAVDFEKVSFFVEGDSLTTTEILENLARKLSPFVHIANSSQRKILHLAAVFANNFTNHLLALAHELTEHHALPFEVLTPLIRTTFEKALQHSPKEIQTGPARRQDYETIAKHLELLEKLPHQAKIYTLLTQSIVDMYKT